MLDDALKLEKKFRSREFFFCYKLNYSYRILNAIFNKLNKLNVEQKETYTKLLNLHPHKQLPVHHFLLYIGMCPNVVYPLVLISKRVPRQAALMNVLPSVMKKKEQTTKKKQHEHVQSIKEKLFLCMMLYCIRDF